MATYTVPANSSIGDAVLNSSGDIATAGPVTGLLNWDIILAGNGFDTWTPQLVSGQVLQIPASVNMNPNNYRSMNQYPANNFAVPGIYELLVGVFNQMGVVN